MKKKLKVFNHKIKFSKMTDQHMDATKLTKEELDAHIIALFKTGGCDSVLPHVTDGTISVNHYIDGWGSLLAVSAHFDNFNMVCDLLEMDAIMDNAALENAAGCGRDNYLIVKKLLEHGANPNYTSEHYGAIHCAARGGGLSVMVELLKYGANVDLTDNHKRTPLYEATQSVLGYKKPIEAAAMVRFLLQHGADPTLTPDILHYAKVNNNEEIVKLITDALKQTPENE